MLCFRKFPVAEKFMDKREGGRVAVSRLSVRSFFISGPKFSVEESFTVALIPGTKRVRIRKKG